MTGDPNDLPGTRRFRLYAGVLILTLGLVSFVLLSIEAGRGELRTLAEAGAIAVVVASVAAIAKILVEKR
jgi:hypothetical protein